MFKSVKRIRCVTAARTESQVAIESMRVIEMSYYSIT